MPRRSLRWARWIALAAVVAVAAVLALRPAASHRPRRTSTPAGAPPALAALERQANALLDGGPRAFKARLAALRGAPVVVNQWASWCGPCRYEFPFFQRLARQYRGRVAFLGVDSEDARPAARQFLRKLPVPYPHYFDPDVSIARIFHGGQGWPTTAFYDRAGNLTFWHIGAYATQKKLDEDIQRYALRD